eukprot:CAMPEP_0173095538 /NCGR_PEP_ID=MMETSP1102-20130122/32019_1 /TAXON_ID=49646 /ORGANISM="Geminigera sp., Strain Caron Lab Isolate" /LENGTH=52 /DNA_ID=CAMNT_0013985511 /DNA_START=849 /DNA_END=1007 /DNA_ORIENTATION=-
MKQPSLFAGTSQGHMIFVDKQALKNGLMCLHRRPCQVLTRKRSRLALGHGAP